MSFKKISFLKYSFFVFLLGCAIPVSASIIDGSISSTYYKVQVCETTLCTVTPTSGVNFGHFTTESQYNIEVLDTELKGYMWGTSFGWVVMNCVNTTSGCSATNGNFKVANNYDGKLSGYAWGQTAGWINFGPFSNSTTAQVTINPSGQFNGYAWAQNFGWIKFDCSTPSDTNLCVTTDWRPRNTRPQCSDGLDNDGDGLIDSADPGCHPSDANANNSASYDPTYNTERLSQGHPSPTPYIAPSTTVAPSPYISPAPAPVPIVEPIIPTTTPTKIVKKPTVSTPAPIIQTPSFPPFTPQIPVQPETAPSGSQNETHYLPTFLRAIGQYLQMIPSDTSGGIPPRIKGPNTPPQTPISAMPATKTTQVAPQLTFFQKVVNGVSTAATYTGNTIGGALHSIGNIFNSLFRKLGK